MDRRDFLKIAGNGALLAPFLCSPFSKALAVSEGDRTHPNIIFIAVDDWNDWVGCLNGYPAIQKPEVKTPNLDRLAAKGMLFTDAHCPAPVCNPSRTAIMTGRCPSTTGIYNNGQWWRPHRPDIVSLPHYFKKIGYHVEGGGKLYHHPVGFNPPDQWDNYFNRVTGKYGKDEPGRFLYHEGADPWPDSEPVAGVNKFRYNFDFGPVDVKESEMPDHRVFSWARDFVNDPPAEPFFLAAGTFRPHLRWYVPPKYFAMYPLDEIELPEVKEDDLEDIPKGGMDILSDSGPREEHELVVEKGKWKEAVQAYLACITFADAQVGMLLDALEEGGYFENSIIVLWSDHGYHLGEKQHWHKFTLWERSTHVPLIISAPGLTEPSSVCHQPVSLMDLYPTLLELSGFEPYDELDGTSLVPLLRDPEAPRTAPVISTMEYKNHTVITDKWRYIRYAEGGEELYHRQEDPNEWHNLAEDPDYLSVKEVLAGQLPENNALGAPKKKRYNFDPASYRWTRKE